MPERIVWEHLGRCGYARALAHQDDCWRARRAGGPDRALTVEHPPTITFGRRATQEDRRVDPARLAALGIACIATDRGGHATYHGPGQLVVYPILDLRARGLGVRAFVFALEAVMIEIAATLGVPAWRDARGHGVWSRTGKLGAVGIRVRQGVTTHGLALNVDGDLAPFRLIAPCGVADLAVTSLAREGAAVGGVAALVPAAVTACERWLGADAVPFAEAV